MSRQGPSRTRTLAGFARPYGRRASLAVATLVVATVTTVAAPLAAKEVIDDGISAGSYRGVVIWVGVFLAITVVGWAATAAQSYLTSWVGERMLADLRTAIFTHVQRLDLGFFERTPAGVVISRLTNDIDAMNSMVTDGPTTLLQNTLVLIGSAVVLLVLDWRLALATLTVFPAMAVGTVIFRRYSARAYRHTRERMGEVTASLQEDISGVRVVQAFRRERANFERFRKVNDGYRAANVQTVNYSSVYFPFVSLLSAVATAVVLGYGGLLVFHGQLSPGALFAFLALLSNFFDPVQQLSQFYQTLLGAMAALDKVVEVLETEPAMSDSPTAEPLPPIAGKVEFDGVRFSYAAGGSEVLHSVSFTAEPGQTIALVGHTGAGKSTIVKLLARFYDPTAGRVLIDGRDLREVTAHSLRSQLGIVPQEGFLFSGSVRSNIAFGRPDAAFEDVVAAAQAVGADEFIRALPDGYDTQIQERGARLSIGQRQLVAFARALLADPRILILDEATSSVDIPTEARIEEALQTLLAGRTALVVAHRLSTIRGADVIVVLEHGEVIEAGTHRQLLALRGRYFALYDDWVEAVA